MAMPVLRERVSGAGQISTPRLSLAIHSGLRRRHRRAAVSVKEGNVMIVLIRRAPQRPWPARRKPSA